MEDMFARLRVDTNARIPISAQLFEQIAWLIASGQIKPDDHLPTLRQLADQLGINMHTVRAAYQQLEAEGLVTGRRGVGTVVLSYDRRRGVRRTPDVPTFTIGVLIPGYNPFYNPYLLAIEESMREDQILTFVGNTRDSPEEVSRYLDQLIAKNVDGVLFTSCPPAKIDELTSSQDPSRNFPPFVFADIPGAPPPSVVFDSESGGYMAGSHLLEHGHTHIGVITCPISWSNAGHVFHGFQRALSERSITLPEDLIATCPEFSEVTGYIAANQLLDTQEPPKAIFASGDILAVGALQAMRERGLRVPDDIALIGFDDSCMSGYLDPPITTIHLPSAEMGRHAISMLHKLMRGEKLDTSEVVLPVRLEVRRSCGCEGDAQLRVD